MSWVNRDDQPQPLKIPDSVNDAPLSVAHQTKKPEDSANLGGRNLGQAADSGQPDNSPVPKTIMRTKTDPKNGGIVNPNDTRRALRRRWYYALRVALDILLVVGAFGLAYFIRYTLQIGREVLEENQVPFGNYFPIMSALIFVLIVTLHFKSYYNQNRVTTLLDDIGLIFSSVLIAVATMIVLVFISRPQAFSRLMFVYLVPLITVLLALERAVTRQIRREFWKRGIWVRNLLVVGATDAACRLMAAVVEKPSLGYMLKGFADDSLRFSEWTLQPKYLNGQPVPHLGKLDELETLVQDQNIDEVVIALPATHFLEINDIMNTCRANGIEFTLVPDLFELRIDALNFIELNGIPLIGMKSSNLTGWNYVIKRGMDIVIATAAILITLPLLLLIALAVKLDSRGPIIYKQIRIGRYGKPFTFYKFRSMKVNADELMKDLLKFNETGGATFKIANDPRRTRVGKFIRRTSLDELPQFFNVLAGQMSFVGPRPPIDREVEKYEEWHHRRLEVTPGLTGLWQVSGRSKLSFEDMVKLDIYYAENWSIWLDIKILLRTLPAIIRGEGAY